MDTQRVVQVLTDSIVVQPVIVVGGDPTRWEALFGVLQQQLQIAVGDTLQVVDPPTMSELRLAIQKIQLRPTFGSRSLISFHHIDQWSVELTTVLLKTIEEPPPFVLIVLFAAGNVELLSTVRSRVSIVRLQETEQVWHTLQIPPTDSLRDQFTAATKVVESESGIDIAFEQWLTGVTDTNILQQLVALRTSIGSAPVNRRLALEAGILVQRVGDRLHDC